jgi:hypothetical protein
MAWGPSRLPLIMRGAGAGAGVKWGPWEAGAAGTCASQGALGEARTVCEGVERDVQGGEEWEGGDEARHKRKIVLAQIQVLQPGERGQHLLFLAGTRRRTLSCLRTLQLQGGGRLHRTALRSPSGICAAYQLPSVEAFKTRPAQNASLQPALPSMLRALPGPRPWRWPHSANTL